MKLKLYLISIIIFLDIIFLPITFEMPFYIKKYGFNNAPKILSNDFIKKPYKGPLLIIYNKNIKTGWLWSQLLIFALITASVWQPEGQKKRYRIGCNLGGPEAAGKGEFGTSRWRTDEETDKTFYTWNTDRQPKKGGVVLGAIKKGKRIKAWIESSEGHGLLVGFTGAGKSRKVFMPSIYEIGKTGESMVITDVKGELCNITSDYLKNQGYEVIRLDFREPLQGKRWNPLYPVIKTINDKDYDKAIDYAENVAYNLVSSRSSERTEPIWRDGAQALLTSIILLVCMNSKREEQKNLSSVYRLIGELSEPDPETGVIPLNSCINNLPFDHPARRAFYPAKIAPDKMRGSFFTQVLTTIRLFDSASMRYLTSSQDFDLGMIGNRPTVLFLVIPDEDTKNHVCASVAIDQTYKALVEFAIKHNGSLPNRVHFLLDEFGNLPKIKDFDQKITVARSRKIKFLLAVQGLNQFKKYYRDEMDTITGNCSIWAFMGTKDPETERIISNMTGKYTISTDNFSSSSSQNGTYSNTRGEGKTGRYLLLPDEVGRWDVNYILILQARELPARLPLLDISQWPAFNEFNWNMKEVDKARNMPDVPTWTPIMPTVEKEKRIISERRNVNKPSDEESRGSSISIQDIENF